MKLLTTALMLLFTTQAFAAAMIDGKYSGAAHYWANDGYDENWQCDFKINETETTLTVIDTNDCTLLPETQQVFDKVGNELFLDGTLWGTISECAIHFNASSADWAWRLSLIENTEGNLSVDEYFSQGEHEEWLQGLMSRYENTNGGSSDGQQTIKTQPRSLLQRTSLR